MSVGQLSVNSQVRGYLEASAINESLPLRNFTVTKLGIGYLKESDS